ncbi:methyltransferase, UbiE/COQ5 family [Radiomyces spectabilis]|uniref:methyltransferase, UbiE/COQ5 family n=1 Tax=Radiomyces spectabilis TaxID=64574 RepID=UPI00221E3D75|nr:methyltransferase, UbiE/COQ5 family [Radiomyces spectabilis]KAI8393733.1 methyltransferase, UbiE/COQ5 family [Radiomyces spectabilis]
MSQYDNPDFFASYKLMKRSQDGLAGAGEWHELKNMIPDLNGKRLLDLGCGYGWHCIYAAQQGASKVVGIDLSQKMIQQAQETNNAPVIDYECCGIEQYSYPKDTFDVVISSLAFHYIASFSDICANVKQTLVNGGDFVFSVEHPVFTAHGSGDWIYDENGKPKYWPVDRYSMEGERHPNFLGHDIKKYHKTLATYVNTLINHGFTLTKFVEPLPEGLKEICTLNNGSEPLPDLPEAMYDEGRRPMMLLISAKLTK